MCVWFRTMRQLGLGKSVLEEAILFEADQLCAEVISSIHEYPFLLIPQVFSKAAQSGEDLEIDGQFNIPVVNVLWSTLAQIRYKVNNMQRKLQHHL